MMKPIVLIHGYSAERILGPTWGLYSQYTAIYLAFFGRITMSLRSICRDT